MYSICSKNNMGKITKINCDLDNEQIKKKIKETKGFWRVQKWIIIYNAKNYPYKAKDLTKHLNISESLVHKTIYEYKKYGERSIEKKAKDDVSITIWVMNKK